MEIVSAVFNRFSRACLILVFVTSAMTGLVFATDAVEQGPKVGDTLPHSIDAPDQTGNQRTFNDLTGENGLILLFNRSVEWCSYCQNQVINWNKEQSRAEALGYKVVILTYDSQDETAKFATKEEISLTLLSDEGSVIIKAFDLLNEEMPKDKYDGKYYGVPHPVIFVIDPTQTITHRFSEIDYKERPEIDLVIGSLEAQ